MYVVGALVTRLLMASPALAAQIVELYGWKRMVPGALAVRCSWSSCLVEIVWRNAVTLPLAARLGPWRGRRPRPPCTRSRTSRWAYRSSSGRNGAGMFWSAFVLKTRSAVPALVSHVLFDLAVLFWFPYVRA